MHVISGAVGLLSSYSSDIDIYSDYGGLGKRFVSNRMLISVRLCIFCMSMYGHCMSSLCLGAEKLLDEEIQ